MLEFFRKRAQTWFTWVIVGFLIIPFALWGINEYFGGGGKLVVATVNGVEIDQRTFRDAYQQQRSRMQEMLGAQYNPSIFDQRIRQEVIDRLVEEELLLQYVKEAGFSASDESVVQTIQGIDAFREEGRFSKEAYLRQLASVGDSPASFEQRVRRFVLLNQLQMGLGDTAIVTANEIEQAAKLQRQQRDLSYILVKSAALENDAVATAEAVEKYYRDNQSRFSTPERASLEYLELSANELAAAITPTDEQLQAYYQDHASQFVVPEERRARHILLELAEDASDKEVSASKASADDIYRRIQGGESFEALAKQHSKDPGSADMGGDLGFFGRGLMEPAFEEVVFGLSVGTVSEPVPSPFGYHIVRVDEVRAEQSRPFVDVRGEVKELYLEAEGERLYFDRAESLTNAAYESPDSLAAAAAVLNLPIKSTDIVERGGRGEGILGHPAVVAAAFSDEVLGQGNNSQPIEIGDHHVVVVRIREHKPAEVIPLDSVRGEISRLLVVEHAREQARLLGERIIAQIDSGTDPVETAATHKLEYKSVGLVGRDDRNTDGTVVRAAFRVPRPADGGKGVAGAALPNGDYAVVIVSRVADVDPAAITATDRDRLADVMADSRGSAAYLSLVQSLRAKAKLVIDEDNL